MNAPGEPRASPVRAAQTLGRRVVSGLARRARRRLARRAAILLYHRVADLTRDPWSLAVSPARFDAHLALIRRRYQPVALGQLVDALRTGEPIPRRAVAVTFDDGYSDVIRDGLPLLVRHRVPATLFVVSGMTDSTREYWWDELERMILDGGELPSVLHIPGAAPLEVPADARSPLLPRDDRGWRAYAESPTPRHALYGSVWRHLDMMEGAVRDVALAAVGRVTGDPGVARADRLPCSSEQLRAFAASGVGTIGAHTETHPALAGLSRAAQHREIVGSRDALEASVGRPVTLFSYPFGHPDSFTPDTEALVRDAGMTAACVNWPGSVNARSDLVRLPRIYVDDIPAESLAWQLDDVFGAP